MAPMDGGRLVTQQFTFTTHGTTTVTAVYTNDPSILQRGLGKFDMYMLRDTHRFLGLDLEYTADQKKIAVVQLGMAGYVLVFHFCRSPASGCEILKEFLQHKGYKFTTVDKRTDDRLLRQAHQIHIPEDNWIDIQDMLNFYDPESRTGMAAMAASIIDPSYEYMKKKFPSKSHKDWAVIPLPDVNMHYAVVDGCLSYEFHKRITRFNYGQRHLKRPREVLCPSCEDAKKRADLPPGWHDDNIPDTAYAWSQENRWEEPTRAALGWGEPASAGPGWTEIHDAGTSGAAGHSKRVRWGDDQW